MEKYNYDELMERALSGKKLRDDEWRHLIWVGEEVDRVGDEPRRWCKWIEVIVKWKDKYYSIGYDEGLTECQEDDYSDSGIIEVKTVKKMVEVIEWQDVRNV